LILLKDQRRKKWTRKEGYTLYSHHGKYDSDFEREDSFFYLKNEAKRKREECQGMKNLLGEKKDLIAAGDSAMIFFKTPM
jgi:hypothetical protein